MRRAFLDACVLFPPLVRGCLLSAAAEELFDPAWSPQVVEEWAWATRRDHGPDAEAALRAELETMATRWPEAEARPEAEPGLSLPDPHDVHVLSAALSARAVLLITFNLRDFPARKLRALGIAPLHPDAFLWELAGAAPEAMS
ncbi:MAG: PIN domain-containing protein, partial [Pseudomonadota bacterium]